MKVKAKKHLGQHFLIEPEISNRIAQSVDPDFDFNTMIEVGPGTGALTRPLRALYEEKLYLMEVDLESIAYQISVDGFPKERVLNQDFLRADLTTFSAPIAVLGNFPYNISSQIVFKILDHVDLVSQMVGMFQKEVAERICASPGSKTYGILSVLAQVYYSCEYLFTVNENAFNPPPKVKSGVMKMTRRQDFSLQCSEKLFRRVVKQAFSMRRKTLRNSLKSLLPESCDWPVLSKRPEQLSIEEFQEICLQLEG